MSDQTTRRRRHRPWWRRRTGRRVLLLSAVVVLLAGVWTAWSALTVYRELSDARAAAADLESALRDQDAARAQEALNRLKDASGTAADRSSGPTWSVLARLPIAGDDVDAVRRMSAALREVSGDGLSPIVRALRDLESGAFDPEGGRLPLDAIEQLGPRLERSQAAFDRAEDQLAGVSTDLVSSQVQDARLQLEDAVNEGLARLAPARRAVRLLPPMLGADGPRTYLLVLQNNAEIRSTAGFPGSTFQLVADDGRIDLVEPVAGNTFEFLEPPGLPVSEAERQLFTDRAATRFVDANFIPDFSQAAELWSARYEERFDVTLDGVVSTDPVTLSYLLQGEDPIDVQGVTLTADNVVQELLSTTYARFEDPADQDEFFRQAGTLVFDRLLDAPEPQSLIDSLRRALDEGRVAVTSTHEREQEALVEGGLAGELGDGAGVFINDTTSTTGSKLSYYLDYAAMLAPRTCGELAAQLDLRSTVPGDPSALPLYVTAGSDPLGTQDLTIFLTAPDGGAIDEVALDGAPVGTTEVEYAGREAVRVELPLAAGASRRLTWQLASPDAEDTVDLQVTPPVQPRNASGTFPSGCG